ncbi:MAG: hypothetical protein BWX84_00074 [Verrucomicrobia bacterium ADurb.Bin118]|jgi:hypothetical protein|nr:MAG: hypothetical protein BWX84_00074 [Verrucomicrobia bacterium ADurb.Bin118]
MAEKRIADLFHVRSRFLRSTQLERDFHDSAALDGYVRTSFIEDCCDRIVDGLRPKSGRRAWRVTGDYGSGKSSFALLLANALAGRDSELPPQLRRVIDIKKLGVQSLSFLPVLVTCSRQPLGTSILRALHNSILNVYTRGAKPKVASEVHRLLTAKQEPSDEQIVDTILGANSQIIADSKGQGLLLIVDELGKFLEFAALNPHRQDVFLLQRLGEAASRSGNEPLFVVCLLHQGFTAYADQLNQSAQREWEKVAGRFDEIVFNQPVEQIGHLIASALNVNVGQIPRVQVSTVRHAMQQAVELGWFGAAHQSTLVELSTRLYPLHPTLLPVVVRIFRRFGQNERSLFSFLLSNEPFGLQAFSEKRLHEAEPYRLHNLFDYVRTNFGHKLGAHSYRSHWNLIESIVESYATEDALQVQILKTVGILNLLNDDLLATEQSVVCALAGDDHAHQRQVKAALGKLHRIKRVLYDRGRGRGLCLWPHTSVDLEKAYDDARRTVQTPQRVAALLKEHLETRPIVARRHYIETGNLRHYDVRYCAVAELSTLLSEDLSAADGVIVVPLCETVTEREVAVAFAGTNELTSRPNWLVAVPQPLSNLASLVQEVQRWEWVATNTLELNADKYGREEASRQLEAARAQLERRVKAQVGFVQFGERTSLEWFRQGEPTEIRDGRHLLSELSRFFDETYTKAPHVHNELVNRRSLSSAAAAARMRLVERMFTHGSSEWLGMDAGKKPPEMSMYLSVLHNTGIHQLQDGAWRIVEPHHNRDKKCNVLPTLKRIREIVQREPDARVNVAALFAELRKPPFGVRDGMIPLLLTVFAIAHEQDVAFYKDGSFLREMTGEHMLVVTKQPERFELQYCKIEGVRAELFEKLLSVLEVKPSGERRVELLDVVKPLCVFVAQLPAYVHNTKKLSPIALSVRDTILGAREPSKLLFTDLPTACGFEPFPANAGASKEVQAFIRGLKSALDELRAAFPELQGRLRNSLREAFDLPGSFQQFRSALARRAEQVVLGVNEAKLRAFCLRLMDDNLPESEWLESLGSFLALKPPAKWHDAEEDLFVQELSPLSTRFHRVESIVFVDGNLAKDGTGIRLAITQANGTEHEQVIHFAADEENRLRELQAQFESILAKDKRLGLAAASRAIWSKLEKVEKPKP